MNITPDPIRAGLFHDRREAGRLLAAKLADYANRPDVIVLALPRGGVPVAKWQAPLAYPWTFLSSASLAFPAMRNSRWARSLQAACACLTISSSRVSTSPSM
jgi:hypothetical protein